MAPGDVTSEGRAGTPKESPDMNDTTVTIPNTADCLEVWEGPDGTYVGEFWAPSIEDATGRDIVSEVCAIPVPVNDIDREAWINHDIPALRAWVRQISGDTVDLEDGAHAVSSDGEFVSWFIPLDR